MSWTNTSLVVFSSVNVKSHAPPREWVRFECHEKDISPLALHVVHLAVAASLLFVMASSLYVLLDTALRCIMLRCRRVVVLKDPTVCRRHHITMWFIELQQMLCSNANHTQSKCMCIVTMVTVQCSGQHCLHHSETPLICRPVRHN